MDLTAKQHMNLLFAQWQGSGPDNILFYGAKTIQDRFDWLSFHEVPVPRDKKLATKNNIMGYEDILAQASECRTLIDKHRPRTLLTIGGDCGVEPVPVSYLNHCLSGDLALVWVDAHGDLNTPQTSPSGHFHGMPLRTICGDGDPSILDTCFSTLDPGQVILAGARQFDPPEKKFIRDSQITCLSCDSLERDRGAIADLIMKKGFHNVYIHIDLDVLDPNTYTNIKHPTPGGINIETLADLIRDTRDRLNIAGVGIVEFVPDGTSGLAEIEQVLQLFNV